MTCNVYPLLFLILLHNCVNFENLPCSITTCSKLGSISHPQNIYGCLAALISFVLVSDAGAPTSQETLSLTLCLYGRVLKTLIILNEGLTTKT